MKEINRFTTLKLTKKEKLAVRLIGVERSIAILEDHIAEKQRLLEVQLDARLGLSRELESIQQAEAK